MTQSIALTRRQFLQRGVLLASTAWTLPTFLERSAVAMASSARLPDHGRLPDQRILVVVQLSGGNDGLNTVIPYRDDRYYRSRPRIAVSRDEVLSLGRDGLPGLHPRLQPLMDLLEAGSASILQGVGYPNPNRSHFASMDIWHTGDALGHNGYGWLGRAMDQQIKTAAPKGAELRGGGAAGENGSAGRPRDDSGARSTCENGGMLVIGREAPLATLGRQVRPVTFEQANLFRWFGSDLDPELARSYGLLAGDEAREVLGDRDRAGASVSSREAGATLTSDPDDAAAFVRRTAMDARVESARVRAAVARGPATRFPNSPLAGRLQAVAAMIRAEMPTRVYYVGMGGFDTHAGQPGRHAALLGQFAAAMKAFDAELRATGHHDRVVTMAFSEFGRRVAENAGQGTDHGAAGPLFLFGSRLKPGLIGDHPSLETLDRGDLVHHTDFRSVYASLLRHWLNIDSHKVLGPNYTPMELFHM